jgi:hypothetical protein
MTGWTRLGWVTALTIMSLLLGGGALNAFADSNKGNHGHGGGASKVEVRHDSNSSNRGHGNAQSNRGHGNDDRDRDRDRDRDDDEDDDDLVTPPARVTDEVRPGKGCGDKNHEHLRHDECPDKFIDDDDDGDDGGGEDEDG